MKVTSITDPAFTLSHAKALASVSGDLNIARRNFSAYPAGHPLIESSISKLIESFKLLCSGTISLQLGITRDGFMLGEDYIEKGNLICRAVAAALFERGVGTLLIIQPPERSEVLGLLGILSQKREDVFAAGGVEQLWQAASITSLQISAIRYDRFSGTEEALLDGDQSPQRQVSVWEQVIQLLMQGEVGLSASDLDGNFRPEVLAALLNADFGRRSGEGSGLSSNTLNELNSTIKQVLATAVSETETSEEGRGTGGDGQDQSGDSGSSAQGELLAFISALDPALRRQIINGFCETVPEEQARELFKYVGKELMQQTYATAEEYAAAPKVLQGILRKLLPHMSEAYLIDSSVDAATQNLKTLLQEHQLETFMPDGYLQGLLDSLKPGTIRPLDAQETSMLMQTLTPQYIDSRGSELLLQLVIADPDGQGARDLIQNLADLCGHFLELGDYGQVLKVLHQAADPRLPQPVRLAMRDAFCRREFLDEILSGLKIWGKPKYEQVTLLIQIMGRAFIDPLLDCLAEEDNMALRRFMMDRVQSFGSIARPQLLARLGDRRWYVLRNIIVLLRQIGSAEDVEYLRPHMRHSNSKVRIEALKSLMMLGDPLAQRQVLRDLDSDDHEIQLSAVALADRSSPPEISRKLLNIIMSGGYTIVECEVKSAAIHALGEIGRVELLPELARVLGARSLLAYKALNKLKFEIVRSFEKYPVAASIPLLERLSQGGDDLAVQAAESLKNLRSKMP